MIYFLKKEMLKSLQSKANRKDGPMSTARNSPRQEPLDLDRIAWRIIEELQQDARLSWAEETTGR